ncbi:MAG: CHAP domain-containing protein [Alphaproteobacteria bacterium]|nr:CHAP domain-containing protein [Alphaproteobacteria bacterium]
MQCVPYAREISGIQIRGDAHTWWNTAQGRYQCSHIPKVGAVLVLSKTQRLKYGHVAVVKNVIDSRTIEVAHSNWGGDRKTRSINYRRMPVRDVSAGNDWSQVRFWHYPSGTYGSIYPVSGFIYPEKLY